jgi:hypothetical protein
LLIACVGTPASCSTATLADGAADAVEAADADVAGAASGAAFSDGFEQLSHPPKTRAARPTKTTEIARMFDPFAAALYSRVTSV